ncbi:MAG: ribonuclease Y [Parcubacteria group bacterium RIFCSPHIGHO2_01_FULL_47_10b]|nr:MAG: ribonuclease Y [Parcubacteria group bacterium RIFCSPHIGHO2_01_FULL_47_10b]
MDIIALQLVVAAVLGGVAGYALRLLLAKRWVASVEGKINSLRQKARQKAEEIILEARQKAVESLEEAKKEEKQQVKHLEERQQRIEQKEEEQEKQNKDLSKQKSELDTQSKEIETLKTQIVEAQEKKIKELEELSGLSKKKAEEQLYHELEEVHKSELMQRLQKLEKEADYSLRERAKNIMALAMQRMASEHTSDLTSYTLSIPSNDIKGRIIGKEGRNIRAFEHETGVEVIVDETPDVITLSSFNPIRREVARIAMDRLIRDGRIQPAAIEKTVADAKKEVAAEIRKAGEEAVYKLGIVGLNPDLIKVIGRLKYRTSYGQNVLDHSIEVARIGEIIAEELGANTTIVKKGGLLHDIGKAVDHEVQGSHVDIGIKILQKFAAGQEVIDAMKSHHGEYPAESLEAVIVEVADAISGARPGARRTSVEEYLKRLEDLEKIANSYEGVQKTYALQAGREVRVFVHPDVVDDAQAKKLARGIANEIEQTLAYPGEIKVHVIRENRVIEYAK